MKPCQYCEVPIRTECPGVIVQEFEADDKPHRCAQLVIAVTLPGVPEFAVSVRVKKSELLGPHFEDAYLLPALEHIKATLQL